MLVDTHVWLWAVGEPHRLNDHTYDAIENGDNVVHLSAASVWEIAIKYERGKLRLPEPPGSYVPTRLALQHIAPLAISLVHALRVAELPPHHRDPFDRLLVAQAQIERLTLVTADPALARYDVDLLWAGREPSPRQS